MKVIDRILLALYALLGTVLLVIAGMSVAGVHISALDWVIDAISYHLRLSLWAQAIFYVLALVLVIWSLYLLVLSFRREKRKDKGCVSIQNTGDGAVRVSVQAMDTLVRRAIGEAEGVLAVKTKILNHEDSITVQIDLTLSADSHIPNVTMVMQRNVRHFIEEFSGIAVREVVILVSEIRETVPAIPAPREEQPEVKPAAVYVEPEETVPAAEEETEAAPEADPVEEAAVQAEEPAEETPSAEPEEPAAPTEEAVVQAEEPVDKAEAGDDTAEADSSGEAAGDAPAAEEIESEDDSAEEADAGFGEKEPSGAADSGEEEEKPAEAETSVY